jgi:molybdenum cofactor cytidylyltransferase
MGEQKLLLPYHKSTIIQQVVENILASRINNVMVVLGADHEKIQKAIEHYPVAFCRNEHPENGMHSSVMCGIKALPDDADAALIYLGDQPEIGPSLTNTILEAYNGNLYGIVIPVHDHHRGHPLLVDLKYRTAMDKLDLENGLRSLMHQFPEDVLEVEVDKPEILIDINTRDEYSNATKPNRKE